jgi:hypothetical protein
MMECLKLCGLNFSTYFLEVVHTIVIKEWYSDHIGILIFARSLVPVFLYMKGSLVHVNYDYTNSKDVNQHPYIS